MCSLQLRSDLYPTLLVKFFAQSLLALLFCFFLAFIVFVAAAWRNEDEYKRQ